MSESDDPYKATLAEPHYCQCPSCREALRNKWPERIQYYEGFLTGLLLGASAGLGGAMALLHFARSLGRGIF